MAPPGDAAPPAPMPAPSTARSTACSISAPARATTSRSTDGGELTVIEQNRESAAADGVGAARAGPVRSGLAARPYPAMIGSAAGA